MLLRLLSTDRLSQSFRLFSRPRKLEVRAEARPAKLPIPKPQEQVLAAHKRKRARLPQVPWYARLCLAA